MIELYRGPRLWISSGTTKSDTGQAYVQTLLQASVDQTLLSAGHTFRKRHYLENKMAFRPGTLVFVVLDPKADVDQV